VADATIFDLDFDFFGCQFGGIVLIEFKGLASLHGCITFDFH
jgi:hypothetical protein